MNPPDREELRQVKTAVESLRGLLESGRFDSQAEAETAARGIRDRYWLTLSMSGDRRALATIRACVVALNGKLGAYNVSQILGHALLNRLPKNSDAAWALAELYLVLRWPRIAGLAWEGYKAQGRGALILSWSSVLHVVDGREGAEPMQSATRPRLLPQLPPIERPSHSTTLSERSPQCSSSKRTSSGCSRGPTKCRAAGSLAWPRACTAATAN